MKYSDLKKRLLSINKKGEMSKSTWGILGIMITIFLIIQFTIFLLPDILTNTSEFGLQNVTTGILANGSVCGEEECVFAIQQTVQHGSMFSLILYLIIGFGLFLLIANKIGLNIGIKGLKGK